MNERIIFEKSLDLDDPIERSAYLEEACGQDLQLCSRVKALLHSHDQANSFLQGAAVGVPADLSCPIDLVGTQIGPYKICEQIGEGGMGVVYVAQQTEPVRRKVALKVIKPGMASKDVVGRFEAERQSLALMNHPNIAQVFDGGTTAAGQPYFVMELVQGLPITEYCDQHRLSTDQRLKLFGTVCKAVQHAHQRGIIHRDIKPSNIIVAEIHADSVPKVIDFGVAKAINQQLINQTVYTQFSQVVGSPLYMSPEQAGLGVIDIDTRSDVYSLGVLLYELLSGGTPFDGELLRSAGFDEMRRIIREDEPPRPSAMVSTLNAQALSTVADRRRIDTRKLRSFLSGELDWLVMKAIEKDRNRRYESASEMAADIERYLKGDAVQACPPSTMYRVKKFARRYRSLLTTASLAVIVLIGGLVATAWQAMRIRQASEAAITHAAIASSVNEFLTKDLLAQADPRNQPNRNIALRVVVDRAAETVSARFQDRPLVEAAIRHALGNTYLSLGRYEQAETQFQRELAIRHEQEGEAHTKTLTAKVGLARSIIKLKRFEQAQSLLHEVLKIQQRKLGAEHPDTLVSRYHLASAIGHPGGTQSESKRRYHEAETLLRKIVDAQVRVLGAEHRDSLSSINFLANMILEQGRPSEAEELYRGLLSSQRRVLSQEHPDIHTTMNNLACAIINQAQIPKTEKLHLPEAEKLHRDLLAMQRRLGAEEEPFTLMVMRLVAMVYARDTPEAGELFREVLEIRQRALGNEHVDTIYSMYELALWSFQQGKLDDARNMYRDALEIHRRVEGNIDLLVQLERLAKAMIEKDHGVEAEELYREALHQSRHIYGDNHVNTPIEHPETLRVMTNLAAAYERQEKWEEAGKLFEEIVDCRRRTLGDEHPETLESQSSLANTYRAQKRFDESEALYRQVIESLRRKLGEEPSSASYTNKFNGLAHLQKAKYGLANLYHVQNRYAEAEELVRQVLKTRRSKLGDNHNLTLNSQTALASTVGEQHRYEEAANLWQELIQMAQGTWDETHERMIGAKENLAETYRKLERYEEQETLLRESSLILIRTAEMDASDTQDSLSELGRCWANLLKKARERGEAEKLFRRAIEYVERVSEVGHELAQFIGVCIPLYNSTSLVEGDATAAEEEFRRMVVDHLAPALELARLAVQENPKSRQRWDMWNEFALAYYRSRNWVGAEVEARLAVKLAVDNPDVMARVVPLFLLAGKHDEYGELCERLLHDCQRWSDSNLAQAVAICSLNPLPPTNPEALLTFAQKAVDEGPDWSIHFQRRIFYRAGEYAKAIEGFTSMESPDQAQMFDLAIAHHLAGHVEEARTWWEKAIGSLKDWDTGYANVRMEVEVIRQEAEHLIFGKAGPNEEHEENTATPVNDT